MGRQKLPEHIKRQRLGPFTLPPWILGRLEQIREKSGVMESELMERAIIEHFNLANEANQQYGSVELLVDKPPFKKGEVVPVHIFRYSTKTFVVKRYGDLHELSHTEAKQVNDEQ